MSRVAKEPPSAEITPEALVQRRREFLKNSALFVGTAALVGAGLSRLTGGSRRIPAPATAELLDAGAAASASSGQGSSFSTDEPKTAFEDITSYNNYYELGLSK